MKKKLISALLTLTMALSLFPASALAVEEGSEALSTDSKTVQLTAGKKYHLTGDITDVNFIGIWSEQTSAEPAILDLNGYSLSAATGGYAAIYLSEGNLKIVNTGSTQSKLVGATYEKGPIGAICVSNNAKLTIDGDILVESAVDAYCISFEEDCGPDVSTDLKGCTLDAKGTGNAIGVNGYIGSEKNPNGSVNITLDDVTIKAGGVGIYQAGAGATTDVKVNRSNITGGETGIEIRSGSLTLSNSTVTGGSGQVIVNPNGNGPTTANAAISVARHTTAKDITVTLDDGVQLVGGAALSVENPQNTNSSVKIRITGGTYEGQIRKGDGTAVLNITGGTFDNDPSSFLGSGYGAKESGGSWTVKQTFDVTFSIPGGVTVKDKDNRIIASDSSVAVIKDESLDFTLEGVGSDKVAKVTVNGEEITPSGSTYTTGPITAATTVAITVEDKPYNVNITAPTNGTVTVDKETAAVGETVTITATPSTGYEVDKVTVKTDTEEIGVTSGNTFKMPAANVTVTVTFKQTTTPAPEKLTVTFDLNGATGTAPEAQEIEKGKTATKPETDPTREGYKFDGWYTDKDGTTAFDFTKAINANTTVYAKWVKEVEATTEVKEDGTATATVEIPTSAVIANEPVTIDATPAADETTTVTSTEVTVPAAAVTALEKASSVEIETAIGTVELPKETIEEIGKATATASQDAVLTVAKADEKAPAASGLDEGQEVEATFEVTVTVGNDPVLSEAAGKNTSLTLTFRLNKNLKNPAVYYVKSDKTLGEKLSVVNAYDPTTGEITVKAPHLSVFAVVADKQTTGDVTMTYVKNNNVTFGYYDIKGLTPNASYVVQLTRGSNRQQINAITSATSDTNGDLKLPAQNDVTVTLWKLPDGANFATAPISALSAAIFPTKQ